MGIFSKINLVYFRTNHFSNFPRKTAIYKTQHMRRQKIDLPRTKDNHSVNSQNFTVYNLRNLATPWPIEFQKFSITLPRPMNKTSANSILDESINPTSSNTSIDKKIKNSTERQSVSVFDIFFRHRRAA